MAQQYAIVQNREKIVARFPSEILATEAYYDLGCYLDEVPSPDDFFEVLPIDRTGKIVPELPRDV